MLTFSFNSDFDVAEITPNIRNKRDIFRYFILKLHLSMIRTQAFVYRFFTLIKFHQHVVISFFHSTIQNLASRL